MKLWRPTEDFPQRVLPSYTCGLVRELDQTTCLFDWSKNDVFYLLAKPPSLHDSLVSAHFYLLGQRRITTRQVKCSRVYDRGQARACLDSSGSTAPRIMTTAATTIEQACTALFTICTNTVLTRPLHIMLQMGNASIWRVHPSSLTVALLLWRTRLADLASRISNVLLWICD